jgi:LysM repeat protein
VSIALGGALLAACGSDDKASDTLPPIATTTTTTTMPPTTTTIPDSYVIQPGDTLFSIATMFGLDTDVLAAYNNIVNKEHIESGQKLKLPPADAATTTIAAVTPTAPPAPTVESSTTLG